MKHITPGAAALCLITSSLRVNAAAPATGSDGQRELAVAPVAPLHDFATLLRGMALLVWGLSKPGTKFAVEIVPHPGSGQVGQSLVTIAGKFGK